MTLEEQVQEAVDYFVRDVPPRHDLADVALRRARRQRRHRWLGLTGGTALAVATTFMVLMADPLGVLENTANEVDPADISPPNDIDLDDPEPDEPALPDTPVEVVVDLDSLPAGPAPAVPWIMPDGLYMAGSTEPVNGSYWWIKSAANVAVGETNRGPYGAIDIIHADGTVIPLSDSSVDFALNADGSRVAWSEYEDPEVAERSTLVVADVVTGQVTHQKEHASEGIIIGGFTSDGHVVFHTTDTFIWNLTTNTVSRWRVGPDPSPDIPYSTVSPTGNLVAVVVEEEEHRVGSTVLDLETRDVLWTTRGDDFVTMFSPDGQYAALWSKGDAVIADARTGIEIVRFEIETQVEPEGHLIWEPTGDLVVEMWETSERPVSNGGYSGVEESYDAMTLVRCSTSGSCERAAGPIPAGES